MFYSPPHTHEDVRPPEWPPGGREAVFEVLRPRKGRFGGREVTGTVIAAFLVLLPVSRSHFAAFLGSNALFLSQPPQPRNHEAAAVDVVDA